jgi:hypothetical protein
MAAPGLRAAQGQRIPEARAAVVIDKKAETKAAQEVKQVAAKVNTDARAETRVQVKPSELPDRILTPKRRLGAVQGARPSALKLNLDGVNAFDAFQAAMKEMGYDEEDGVGSSAQPPRRPRPPRPPPGEVRELEEDEYTDTGYEEYGDAWDEKQLAYEERLLEWEQKMLEFEPEADESARDAGT